MHMSCYLVLVVCGTSISVVHELKSFFTRFSIYIKEQSYEHIYEDEWRKSISFFIFQQLVTD